MQRNGQYEITGPGTEGRRSPEYGPAVSLATTLAARPGTPEGTWYVRDPNGAVVAQVERHSDRSVTIRGRDRLRPTDGDVARAKNEMAEEVSL